MEEPRFVVRETRGTVAWTTSTRREQYGYSVHDRHHAWRNLSEFKTDTPISAIPGQGSRAVTREEAKGHADTLAAELNAWDSAA
jgi:hypothetical protein